MKFLNKDGILIVKKEHAVKKAFQHKKTKKLAKTLFLLLILVEGISYLLEHDFAEIGLILYEWLDKLHIGNFIQESFTLKGQHLEL